MVDHQRRWRIGLGLVCALGLAVRLGYLLVVNHPLDLGGDPYQYHRGANLLVEGQGFIDAFAYDVTGAVIQSAQHPPLHYLALAIPSALGMGTLVVHQVWTCLLGTATVAVIALVGRRLASPRAGLIAGALAAVYPNLWVYDGTLAAETTALLMVSLVVLAAYRLWARPSVAGAMALGALGALAALTRSEAVLLVPLVVVPLALAKRELAWRQRLALVVLPGLAAAAVVAPWFAYNAARFHHPVVGTSTGYPLALVQANCDRAYYGSTVGYYAVACIPEVPGGGDETDQGKFFAEAAAEYRAANASRRPFVAYARLGRTFGFYQPLAQVRLDIYVDSRRPWVAWSGLIAYYPLVAGAVIGAVVLRRRGVALSPLVGVLVTVVGAVVLTFGQTRYRASAEVVFVLLSAVALDRFVPHGPWALGFGPTGGWARHGEASGGETGGG